MAEFARYWSKHRETMSRDERNELRDERLSNIVAQYYQAPVIRDLWDEAGITPDDINGVDDLSDVPIFRKPLVREYMFEKGDGYGGRLTMSVSEMGERGSIVGGTGGTTGAPSNILLTDRDVSHASEVAARHLWSAGLRPGDTFFNFSPPRAHVMDTMTRAAHKIGAVSAQAAASPAQVSRMAHTIENLEPKVVFILSPPLIDALNEYMDENDIDPQELWDPVESAIFTAGPLIDDYRRDIESKYGIDLYELGGSTEPRWSCQDCSAQDGWLHVPDDFFYLETVDPETGDQLGERERGELVVTTLTYEGMAHVRWGSDDIGEIRRDECACGRTTTRVNIYGRIDDLVEVEGKKLLPWDVLEVVNGIEAMPGNVFQFYEDSTEELRIRLGYGEKEVTDTDTFRTEVTDSLERALEVPVDVTEIATEKEIREETPGVKIPRVVEE